MRTIDLALALALGSLSLGACFDDTRTIELETDEVRLPLGTGTEIGVWVDGRELSRLDAFSWYVENKDVVSLEMADDGAHVRITGREPGTTIVHLGYRTTSIPLRAIVLAPSP